MQFTTLLTLTTLFLSAIMAVPIPRQESNKKIVVAHHMIGNTFPYTLNDWEDDIAQAHAAGIDGFALNMGRDEWQPQRVNDAYEAAKQSGTEFKLFLSLDMSSFPCGSPADAQALRSLVLSHATHPSQLLFNSKVFVSTFAGESCSFGSGSSAEGWSSQFTVHPELKGKIHFVPSFFVDPVKFGPGGEFAGVVDGDFNWNSAWPIQLTTEFAASLLADSSDPKAPKVAPPVLLAPSAPTSISSSIGQLVSNNLASLSAAVGKLIGSTETDTVHRNALFGNKRDTEDKTYMASVSPYFFTHYGAESFNKNFVFLSDQHLYSTRWEALIADRANVDIVQILTWNDYGESHYIGPIKGGQPFGAKEDNGNGAQGWADGMDHQAWLKLTKFYATAFKTSPPTGDVTFPTIDKDEIIMWARPHPAAAKASDDDAVGPPKNFELFQDNAWVVVMTTAPATVFLSTSVEPPTNAVPIADVSSLVPSSTSSSTSGLQSTVSSTTGTSSSIPLDVSTTSSSSSTAFSSSSTSIYSSTPTSDATSSSTDTTSSPSANIITVTLTSDVPEPTQTSGLFGADIFRRQDTQPTPETGNTRTFQVPAGITKLSIPLTVGGSMYARIERDGATVATVSGYGDSASKNPTFKFNGSPKKYNFNAFVLGSS